MRQPRAVRLVDGHPHPGNLLFEALDARARQDAEGIEQHAIPGVVHRLRLELEFALQDARVLCLRHRCFRPPVGNFSLAMENNSRAG